MKVKTPIQKISLLNGIEICHLAEIPSQINFLIVDSIRGQDSFRHRLLDASGFKHVSEEKWNLILYLINRQSSEIRAKEVLKNIKNYGLLLQLSEINFEALQKKIDLVNMPKLETRVVHTYAIQIESAVNYLIGAFENCRDHSENSKELIKKEEFFKQYAHFLNKTLQDSGLVTMRQQVITKAINDSLEELENSELNKPHSEIYLLYLDYLLQNEGYDYKTYLMKVAEDFAKIYEKNRAEKESSKVDYTEDMIFNNIKRTGKILERAQNIVHAKFPALILHNIPKLQKDSKFSRRELFRLYSRYKGLCILQAERESKLGKEFDGKRDFDLHTFKKSLIQFSTVHDDMVRRIFSYGGEIFDSSMNWYKYVKLMVALRAKSVGDKLDLFFRLIDSDGNGLLSWNEIYELALLALETFRYREHEPILEELARYFADHLFRAVKMSKDTEIPVSKLKEIILEKNEAVSLLLMLCSAEQEDEERAIIDGEFRPISQEKIGKRIHNKTLSALQARNLFENLQTEFSASSQEEETNSLKDFH